MLALRFLVAPVTVLAALTTGCGDDGPTTMPTPGDVSLTPLFQTEASASCAMASPLAYRASDGTVSIVTVALDGLVRAYDPDTGAERFTAQLPAPDGETPLTLSTPVIVGDKLVVAWQNTETNDGLPNQGTWRRRSHQVGVFDLQTRAMDPAFETLLLAASVPAWDGGSVEFRSSQQLLRSALQHVRPPDTTLGLVYVSLGNGPSLQPFHGWVFEVDLDRWMADGADAALTGTFLSTKDNECSADVVRLDTMVCGGGVWTPSGLHVSERSGGAYELIVPTGNGRVDLAREDYAHGLLRMGRGLDFDPGCDASLCADFDDLDWSVPCLESCSDMFIPRMPVGETYQPESGVCEGMNFVGCYGRLDLDFGSSAPVEVQIPDGPRVFVQPAKDGGLYLIDAENLGTMHDRVQVLAPCGTADDECGASWAGQFVTTPVVFEEGGDPVVAVAGHMFDVSHDSGVTAYRLIMRDGQPRFELAWAQPERGTEAAKAAYRRHPGRPIVVRRDDQDYVLVVETGTGGAHAWLIGASDGRLSDRVALSQGGTRYSQPLVLDERVYIGTCTLDGIASGRIEAFTLESGGGAPVTDGGVMDAPPAPPICEPGGRVCGDEEHCERSWCSGPGLCRGRPATCDPGGPAVCGCDGSSYDNACEAARAGATIDPDGDC